MIVVKDRGSILPEGVHRTHAVCMSAALRSHDSFDSYDASKYVLVSPLRGTAVGGRGIIVYTTIYPSRFGLEEALPLIFCWFICFPREETPA